MTPRGLATVAKLRRISVLRAQAELARRHAREQAATRAEAAAAAAIVREVGVAGGEAGADALNLWLASAWRRVDEAGLRRAETQREVGQARADLCAADVAQAAIDRVIALRARAASVRQKRAEQVLIDETAARRFTELLTV